MITDSYGYLSETGDEYIISRPDTPRPWVNYLTNGRYAALCSHRGGGFSFFLDHRYHSILRRGAQITYEDLPGRLVYLKDLDTGELWTANVTPFTSYDRFEARHGIGRTCIASEYREIASDLNFFVPWDDDAEVWQIRIANRGYRPRRLAVTVLAEVVLGNVSLEDHEAAFMALFNEAEIGSDSITLRKNWWHPHFGWSEENGAWPLHAKFVASQPFDSATTDRETFFGPFRNHSNPIALERESLPSGSAIGQPLVCAAQWSIALDPGQDWKVNIAVGVDGSENRALATPGDADAIWQSTKEAWEKLLSRVSIETPDEKINAMINFWAKLQTFVTFSHGRGPSYFHKGQYLGMRDVCQDTFGFGLLDPERARANILRIGSFFFRDGRCAGGCNRIGLPEGPAEKSDLPLWLVLAVADYVRETADFGILGQAIPYLDGGESSLLDKLTGGIDRMIGQTGPHGLPLMGKGDWNDAANGIGAGGQGESVWLGQFLIYVIREITPLLQHRGDLPRLERYKKCAAQLRDIINAECWDGGWFVRAFKDNGEPVGVRGQAEGFIWINSQTWAVLSDCSTPERLDRCLDSVEEHLGTEDGLMNLAPAYTRPDDEIGVITRFRPGWKENAAVFSHASAFHIVARALRGRGDAAVDLLNRLLPLSKDPECYKLEPYIFSQFVAGPADSAQAGQGAFHWLTGTPAWILRAVTDYIFGIRAEEHGLRVAPSVSRDWKHFAMRRHFRGSEYHIEFSNPDGVENGVARVEVDGQPIQGTLIPAFPAGERHDVRVVMGVA